MAAITLLTLLAHRALPAQQRSRQSDFTSVIAGNAVVGGVTAALHATIARKPVGRALLTGALGGATHAWGKTLTPNSGLTAVAVSAVGTSIVANAGRGASPLDMLVLPLGPARIRFFADSQRKFQFALNAYESAMLARRLLQPAVRMDWVESLRAGAFVLRTTRPLYVSGERRAAGLTAGSVILVSDLAWNSTRTLDHERVHAQQGWFFQEVWGRPIEHRMRERTSALRWIPRWLEIGVVPPLLLHVERKAAGSSGPMRSWQESEAETIENWSRR